MTFILLVTTIVIINTLFLTWFIKQYFKHQLDKKVLDIGMYSRMYFSIEEAMICVECDCVFSKHFQECPVCGNAQNLYLNCALDPVMQYQQQLKLHKIISQEAYV